MSNTNSANAKTAKNNELYTQFHDIPKEINVYIGYVPDVFRGTTYADEGSVKPDAVHDA